MSRKNTPSVSILDAALGRAASESGAGAVAVARARQAAADADRARVLEYMREVPGRSYEESASAVGYVSPIYPVPYEAPPVADGGADPHAAPPDRDAIMSYLRAHPGMSYERAVTEVRSGK